MSLNSLQDSMSRRAASMAAMAKRATNPEEIQAIQQSLVTGVQNGSIQPYIGIPLIQDLTKKLTEAKASMAQNVAGAGMPQPPAGGPPIAQQVMQQAAQADQSQGVEALPSNLPQSYAGGGIIAFEEGGQVERYQNRGYTGDPAGMGGDEIMSAAGTGDPYVGRNFFEGLLSVPEEPEWKRQLKLDEANKARNAAMGIKPSVTPYDPATATRRALPPLGARAAPAAPGAGGGGGGGGGSKMPVLAGMEKIPVPTLTDYSTFTAGMPEKTKAASEAAVKASQTELEGFDKPGFEAREGRLSQREAAQDKDSAIGRALNLMSLGFGIAGSKERSLAGALGKEGREGIVDLIKGEAANRAAKDRLEDARDNLKQQEVAAKKSNYQAAQAAGERAADNLYKSQDFTMKAAHYGNTEALQRYNTQGDQAYRGAALDQSGKLGLAGLDLQNRQLAQTGAFQNKQLEMMGKRYDAMDKQAQARIQQVHAGAMSKFMENTAPQLNAQFTKDYGPNWRTAKDPRSLEAQRKFKQAQNAYIIDALGQHDASMMAPDASDL